MMNLEFSGFDWDEGNAQKCLKHGVTKEEIEDLFLSEGIYLSKDSEHSNYERRMQVYGETDQGKFLFVAFTFQEITNNIFVRPISARYMHDKEVGKYEKTNSSF